MHGTASNACHGKLSWSTLITMPSTGTDRPAPSHTRLTQGRTSGSASGVAAPRPLLSPVLAHRVASRQAVSPSAKR